MDRDITRVHREGKPAANEVLVVAAMALVAAAVGIGAYFEAELAAWLAAATALAVFAVLVGIHLAARRPARAPRTDIDQLEAEIAKLNVAARGAARKEAPWTPAAAGPAARREPRGPIKVAAPVPVPRRRDTSVAAPADGSHAPPAGSRSASNVDERAPTAAAAASAHEFWSHQTPTSSAPTVGSSSLALPSPEQFKSVVPDGQRTAPTPREADVEMVQGLVKKLVAQVSAAEANAPVDPSQATPRMDGAIEASLEALRATADTMRTASGMAPATPFGRDRAGEPAAGASAPPRATDGPSSPAGGEPRGTRALVLAEALSATRADILLEPILNLEDRRVRHYGVALRLKAADGTTIDGEPGREPGDAAFGPAVDGLRLARTAQLARRLAERGKLGFIFFDVGGSALSSDRYVAEVAVLCQEPAAWVRQLVPTLTQTDVAAFTTKEWDALRDIGKAGLCFSLKGVESLDMNFTVIRTWGFAFVEIDAARFLAGLPRQGKPVSALEATRQIIDAGLTPIVGGLDEDAKLTPVVAAGALLGRGPLFGAPRPVKAEALEAAGQHAA